jgi:mercuric ion binding protein
MRHCVSFGLLGIVVCLLAANVSRAETKVTVSETHLCCGMCLTGVTAALKDVEGVTHKSSQQAKTIEIVAQSDEAAQKAINALAAAGFYGKLDSDKVKYPAASAPEGIASKVQVSGIHNCCGACTRAITAAVKAVPGVNGTDIKARDEAFTVEGNFQPGELLDALLKAGFYAQVKKS